MEKNLYRVRKKKRKWVQDTTLDKIEQCREHKRTGNMNEWKKLRREIRRKLRRDKTEYTEKLCKELELLSNDPKKLYQKIREINRQFTPRQLLIRDEHGTPLNVKKI